ncbi:MAG: hypothetical protein J6V01_02615 [Clostridia bacterium]|nr:hypothetical protein [Clostridia bacterium]
MKNRRTVILATVLLSLVLFVSVVSAADRDGYTRKDGIAAKITLTCAGEEGGSAEVEIVNENCAFSDRFSVELILPEGLSAEKSADALTLTAGQTGKAEFSFVKAAESAGATAPLTDTGDSPRGSGCGSSLAVPAVAVIAGAALFASRGRKRRGVSVLLAALMLIPASVLGTNAAVTSRSLDLAGKIELEGAEYSVEARISYDYDFREEKGEATTGMDEFGITYYWGPHDAQAIDETFWQKIAECGFTTVPLENNSVENNKIALGLMKKYGLTCSSLWDTRIWQIVESTSALTDEQIENTVAEVVADYAEFDNIRGWWLQDEPSSDKFPILGRVVAAFRKIDPERECLINLFPNYAKAGTQLKTADYDSYLKRYIESVRPGYISYDHYHFIAHGSPRKGFFSNLESVRSAALGSGIDYMQIILLTHHLSYEDLTFSQILFELNMSLAYGCKRISYFTFILDQYLLDEKWDNACMSYKGEIYPHYYDVQKINRQILPLGRELFGKRSVGVYQIGVSSNEVGCVRYSGYGDLGEVDGKSFTVGFFDDGSFMIVNRKYVEGELGKNSLTFVDVTAGLEYFDAETASWKEYTSRDADGRYIYECRAGEGLLFRVK